MADMTQAVILARGLGTRMRQADADARLDPAQAAIAQTGLKAMIPIDRPFLDYVLHELAEAGYTRACLVIGPEHDSVRDYYTRQVKTTRIAVEFAIQPEPRGTADAVAAAEAFADGEPFLVINSDNHYPPAALAALRGLDGPGLVAFDRDAMLAGSNIPPERIAKFAVVETDPAGHLRRIVEKPDAADLARLSGPVGVSMNCWRFGPAIFTACRNIEPSPRGELEIPSAVEYAIERLGECFTVVPLAGAVLDLSSRADIEAVAQRLRGREVRL